MTVWLVRFRFNMREREMIVLNCMVGSIIFCHLIGAITSQNFETWIFYFSLPSERIARCSFYQLIKLLHFNRMKYRRLSIPVYATSFSCKLNLSQRFICWTCCRISCKYIYIALLCRDWALVGIVESKIDRKNRPLPNWRNQFGNSVKWKRKKRWQGK